MKNKHLLGLLISLAFFVINLLVLSDYGISWDNPDHFLRGQAYWHFFLTGEKDYQNLTSPQRSFYQWGRYPCSYYLENDAGHPPLNDIFASFSNYLFFQKLGVLGDIESYHLFIVLASSLLVYVVFRFTHQIYGFFAAIVACLSLSLYPLFLGESHFNIKDPVEASFYAFTLYAFYQGIVKKSPRWLIFSSLWAGLSLGTKFNIFFAAPTLFFWLIIYYWQNLKSLSWPLNKKMTLSLIIYPLIPLGILFAFWPYLWQSPLENFKKIIDYYQEIGLGTTYQPQEFYLPGGFNTYALQWILYTTPLVILFFSLVGIMAVVRRWRKEQNTPSLLILFWFLVPILRVSLPKMGIYGGIRQIMEFIPAMAILAGLGAKYFITVVAHFSARLFPNLFSQKKYIIRYTLYIILLLTFLPILIKMIQIHPNQNVYFNPLIGGLKGAKARDFPDWGNSMGNVYRQGLNWINENAESQAELAFAYELLGNLPRIWVREDIKFTNLVRSGLFREGEYLIGSVTEPKAFEWYQLRYPEKFLIPVYQLQVDGVTLLKVWKNDHEHSRPEYLLPEKTIQPVSFKVEDVFLTISLPQEVLVTRIYFQLEKIGPEELKECLNETDSGGTFKFFPQKEKPLILPAASRVLAHKIKYQGPFYLFAAEKAKKIKFHFGQEGSCFEKTKTINVYRLKNLKP